MTGKPRRVELETMVKYLLQEYDIPTRRDLKKIHTRLDKLEKLIEGQNRRPNVKPSARGGKSAISQVFDVISGYKKGARFADIKRDTGFDDKSIRNVIYRLDKLGKIVRVSHGLYVVQTK